MLRSRLFTRPDFTPDQLKANIPALSLSTNSRVVVPPGVDDCGAIECPGGILVITTDFVNAWPAMLRLQIGTMTDYGALLAKISLSDLLSSGARPLAMTLALGLPPEFCNPETYHAILAGASEACKELECAIVGGDTKGAKALSCSSTGVGYVSDPNRLRLCGGLRAGHLIAASGPLGMFNMAVLEATERTSFYTRHESNLNDAIARPRLPIALARELSMLAFCGAGTDISDGLGVEVHKMIAQSGLGVRIFSERIPVHPLVEEASAARGIAPWAFSFAGGGDCQFIFSAPPSILKSLAPGFTVIGEVIEQQVGILSVGGIDRPLPSFGHSDYAFDDFAEEIRAGLRLFPPPLSEGSL